ncbi:ABC transporter ATP-binding protein [Streptomyces rochei]|nr:ABC transporter ATP-binding protein [Streptomyces rochei]
MSTSAAAQHAPGRAPGEGAATRARGLTKAYGAGETAVLALDSVDVDIARGRFTAVMGPSGSGKSTLMHCLAGLDTVSAGQVWLGETEITGLRERELTRLRRDRIGFMFQGRVHATGTGAARVDGVRDPLGHDRGRGRRLRRGGGRRRRAAPAAGLADECAGGDRPRVNALRIRGRPL